MNEFVYFKEDSRFWELFWDRIFVVDSMVYDNNTVEIRNIALIDPIIVPIESLISLNPGDKIKRKNLCTSEWEIIEVTEANIDEGFQGEIFIVRKKQKMESKEYIKFKKCKNENQYFIKVNGFLIRIEFSLFDITNIDGIRMLESIELDGFVWTEFGWQWFTSFTNRPKYIGFSAVRDALKKRDEIVDTILKLMEA